ncbi:hypothetical protein DM01DRAFT_1335856 [Hesseltinella vesiculosa]|uniref:Uncharacterized protein n=1 Tax=Hesseltinella vesiculosa TaxID=101127 RepID=A0A1X2GHI3_9FUNG|nr:hypothetical protein DM01DRAFT_1335856 [Hesseltinella vesiculosa]
MAERIHQWRNLPLQQQKPFYQKAIELYMGNQYVSLTEKMYGLQDQMVQDTRRLLKYKYTYMTRPFSAVDLTSATRSSDTDHLQLLQSIADDDNQSEGEETDEIEELAVLSAISVQRYRTHLDLLEKAKAHGASVNDEDNMDDDLPLSTLQRKHANLDPLSPTSSDNL